MSNTPSKNNLLFSLDKIGIHSSAQALLDRVKTEKSGIIAVTGQPATGKTTTLFSFALEASYMGFPISVVTGTALKQEFDTLVTLPKEWDIHDVADDTERSWSQSLNVALETQESVIVVTSTEWGVKAAIEGVRKNRWMLIQLDTPFVGMDVTYNLRARGLTNQEILGHFSGIVSQMLFPRLCQECAEMMMGDFEEARLVYPDADSPQTLWREVGCEQCDHRGTRQRCAAYGLLLIDDETRPMVEAYLEEHILPRFPASKYTTIQHSARELVKQGKLGIGTYKREVFQNPLLRTQHLLEQEQQRSTHIKRMFERFVTHHVAEHLISQKDFERIVKGENRRVTCVFADICGFTTRSEHAPPTEIFRLLNEYFSEMIEIIFEYQGTIDKFIGDAIMVIFGAPVEQPDHALRAVQCAIAIQKKIAELNHQHPDSAPVEMSIGINSGEAVAGCLGNNRRMDYTVLGDTINTASRLEGQANAGQILLGFETFQAVQNHIQCRKVGHLKLKGKVEELETFEVIYSYKSSHIQGE